MNVLAYRFQVQELIDFLILDVLRRADRPLTHVVVSLFVKAVTDASRSRLCYPADMLPKTSMRLGVMAAAGLVLTVSGGGFEYYSFTITEAGRRALADRLNTTSASGLDADIVRGLGSF